MRILIVEDDKPIATGLIYSLEQENYETIIFHTYKDASEVIASRMDEITLCLFDLSLPDGSGYDLCKQVKEKRDLPVIFLTAMDDEVNVVMGLDMGADDYITKPFRIRELISRIHSVLRRYEKHVQKETHIKRFGHVTIDTMQGKVFRNNTEVELTAMEYRLLLIFVSNPTQILEREQILDKLWDAAGEFVNDNTLTVYIKRLREKIEENPQKPTFIATVRGVGYKIGDVDASQ
ncbi:MAG TPA: response regulator transcription factor [Bacillota bacterium]|nr:response regulator transcription factor [Bacillota bacterium]